MISAKDFLPTHSMILDNRTRSDVGGRIGQDPFARTFGFSHKLIEGGMTEGNARAYTVLNL